VQRPRSHARSSPLRTTLQPLYPTVFHFAISYPRRTSKYASRLTTEAASSYAKTARGPGRRARAKPPFTTLFLTSGNRGLVHEHLPTANRQEFAVTPSLQEFAVTPSLLTPQQTTPLAEFEAGFAIDKRRKNCYTQGTSRHLEKR